ncbi:MAG: tyrosine-type recombinase/integrase, partial [Lachnospiraceae bacterium]|nr:tyrosine-type recombinase/integrase [Lachnospiraceae bacterium]
MSKKPSFSELFFSKTKDYLDVFLLRQEQRSKDTVKAYRISLTEFYRYVTEQRGMKAVDFRFSDCSYDLVIDFSQYLQESKKLSNSTVNQRLAAIKSYLKYVSDGDIELMQVYLSVQKVPLLRLPKLQRPVMEKDELEAFFSEPKDTRFGRRDRVILILLFDTAIRVSELTGIVIGDVSADVKKPSIMIHGKGRKTRSVMLNDKCARQLKDYISHYHDQDPSPDTPLFFTVIHGRKNHMS